MISNGCSMDVFTQAASQDVTEKVQNFLDRYHLTAGKLRVHTLMDVDVYVAWNTASRTAFCSRVIPFGDADQAQEAVRILKTPAQQAQEQPALIVSMA
jgi:hypothetical protein